MKKKYRKMNFWARESTLLRSASIVLLSFLLVLMSFNGNAVVTPDDQETITGVVTDGSEAIPGANVIIKGTSEGVVTDFDGKYRLTLPSGLENPTLVFSFVGFQTQEVPINGRSIIDVTMDVDLQSLEEVVVVGYGNQKRVTLTGSVAQIESKELAVTKNENVINMLTGKLPGVRVVQKSSRPGAYDTQIDIRGMGEPLFVVDGMYRDQAYFARMNPEEIESISILKDGAAAIYGVRAANGVVLVTTKSGTAQEGKVDITFNTNFSMQQFLYVPQGVSAQDYMTLRNEQNWQDFNGNYFVRRNPVFSDDQIQPYLDGKPSYDWMGAVFKKTTPQVQHNLGVNGGSEKLRYFFSLGYSKQDGNFTSGDLWSDRINLRSNIDAQITDRLNAKVMIGGILTTTHEPYGSGWSTYKNTWLLRPDAPIYANDNPLYPNGDAGILYDGHNMLIETDADYVGYNLTKDRRVNSTLMLEYDIPGIEGLSAKGSYDYLVGLPDYTNYRSTYNLYVYSAGTDTYTPSQKNTPSSIQRSADFNSTSTMRAGLYYDNTFGQHSFNSFLIFEEAYYKWENFSAYRELKIDSEYLFAGEDQNQQARGGSIGDRLTQSAIGQVTYDYQDKYLVDFKFRYDASSRFPAGSRLGFFPSISAGWRISEEGFMDNVNFISNLKLRASYGEMGDDNSAANYPPTTGYSLNGNDIGWYYNGVLSGGVSPTGIPNPNLTWYQIQIYNLAVDFGLMEDKLRGSLEVYKRDRSGLLATSSAVVPGTVGAELPQENLNNDRNFGYEISLSYRNHVNKFSYFVNPQISATKSMRTSWLETPAANSYDRWRNRTSGRFNNIWWGQESGEMLTSYDQIRTYDIPLGQGTLPGDWTVEDWNGDGVINGNDDHPIATLGLPVFNYGIMTGASWNNFDLQMNFQGAHGVYVQYSEVLVEALAFGGQNTLDWFLDRWRPVDPDADYFNPNTEWISGYYPVTGHNGRRTGNNNVQNSSYIRLKTLELGYTLPVGLVSKAGIKNLRVYVNAYNLLTFTGLEGVDPERPGSQGGASTNYIDFYSYPVNRTLTLGASLKF